MVKNPVRQIKINGLIALFAVTILYVLTNIAYLAASKYQPILQNKFRHAEDLI